MKGLPDMGSSWWSHAANLLWSAFWLWIVYYLAFAIYNVWFHPLKKYPGPQHWIAFPILFNYAVVTGELDSCLRKFHDRYGEIVRFAPDRLSFIKPDAWKDIYGHGHAELPKAAGPVGARNAPAIFTATPAEHFRYRRSMLPAFSARALRDQEPLVTSHIDLLIAKLRDVANAQMKVEMFDFFNRTTFDIIGDLAFGEQFNTLKDLTEHEWLEMLDRMLPRMHFIIALSRYPYLYSFVMLFLGRKIERVLQHHKDRATRLTQKRIHNPNVFGRGDIMDYMLRSRGHKHGLSDEELASNADILIFAGSETVSTLLAGATFWLLMTPHALRKVNYEVRNAFTSESDINFRTAAERLPYLQACIEEALRMYPPVPSMNHRKTPIGKPTPICGEMIPENTIVGIHHSAAFWSGRYFHNPRSFVPERWLPLCTTDTDSPYFHDRRDIVRPFSYGPRDCIGQGLAYHEMRTILARFLWNFDMELCPESAGWENQKSFTVWQKKPLMVRLNIRKGA